MRTTRAIDTFVGSVRTRASAMTRAQWVEAGVVAGIALMTALLYLWGLSRNGMGNSYYAAAVKSATLSWKAFLFGSLDPGSFITVDKPPFAFWIQALSCRVFGFSSWSMLVPQALAGVATVLILHRMVRRWIGRSAAVLAALAMALTPVAVVMFRFNNPDALLTFLLVASAWALWSALEKGSTWTLVVVGALVGLAFTTKMLEAIIVLPVFAVVYLAFGRRSVVRRVLQLVAGGVAAVVAASWWVLAVMLWPAASRPFIGGSSDNSALGLAFSRTAGYFSSGSGGPGLSGGPSFSGSSGWLRMFNAQLGNQISWLLPLALFGLAAGLWVYRSRPRTDLHRAGFVLWGLWTLLFIAVFSDAEGVLHPYYTVVLAPSVAALVGGGFVALWKLSSSRRWLAWLLPAGIVGSVAWSASLLGRTPDYVPGLAGAILVVGVLAAIGLGLVLARVVTRRAARYGLVVVGCACLLAGPFAYAVSTISRAVSGPVAAAGPVSAAAGDSGFPGGGRVASNQLPPVFQGGPRGTAGIGEDLTVDEGLISYLKANRGTTEYLVAVQGATSAVPIILDTGLPVVAMGGFSGGDPAPTLAELQAMVAAGRIHYVLVSGGSGMGPGTGGPPGMGGLRAGSDSELTKWLAAHGTVVPSSDYGGTASGTLYYLSSSGA
jgi:4-amino-4-deoxy-L-arabinose transferase-like glycosyltransferase